MTTIGVLRILLYLAVVFVLVKPLGGYMARVYEGGRTIFDPVLRPLERLLYRFCRIDPQEDMTWQTYTIAMLVFTLWACSCSTRCSGCRGRFRSIPRG